MNDALVVQALTFAAYKHRHQKRKGTEHVPYINHPLEVLSILRVEAGVTDSDVLCAAVLHDTVEDTDTSIAEIEQRFGSVIAALVAEVTDDKTLPKQKRKELQILHAPHASPNAKLVKLADKIANVRDMVGSPPATWPFERIWKYLDWSECVAAGLCGAHPLLEKLLQDALAQARRAVKTG